VIPSLATTTAPWRDDAGGGGRAPLAETVLIEARRAVGKGGRCARRQGFDADAVRDVALDGLDSPPVISNGNNCKAPWPRGDEMWEA